MRSNAVSVGKFLSLLTLGLSLVLPVFAQEVNIYSGRKEELIKPLLDEFTKETGIQVNLITGKSDGLLSRMRSEGEFSPADLVILADVGRLVRAKKLGLTQAMNNDALEQMVNASLRDSEGYWIGLTKRARPIMYKKGSFDPSSIKSLSELADERFKGQICVRSSNSIYNQSLVSSLIKLWGEKKTLEWVKGVVKNFARKPKGGDRDQIKALVAGECSIAIANTYYLGGMLGSKDPASHLAAKKVGVIWNDQNTGTDMGVHVNISGGAVAKYAKNKANAEKLLAFMLKKNSQKWYAEVNHEYPVIENIALSPELASFGEFEAQNISLQDVGNNNAAALIIMDKAGWK